jgi:hypothetical protein
MVEHLSSKHEHLSSTPVPTKRKKKEQNSMVYFKMDPFPFSLPGTQEEFSLISPRESYQAPVG